MGKPHKKAEECHEETAPLWYITYADMITQLMAFFVVLFTMSEIKSDKLNAMMSAFQNRMGVLPKNTTTFQIFSRPKMMRDTDANVLRQGPMGKHLEVQSIIEDNRSKKVIGGRALFAKDSANLLPEGKHLLASSIAPDMRGYKNRIRIKGHSNSILQDNEKHELAWNLAYRRAYAVFRYLVDECNLDERCFEVISCGDRQPMADASHEFDHETNDRVEIVMTDEKVSLPKKQH